jgi:hypothetical protein
MSETKRAFLIECVTHGFKRWDVKEQKDVPARLFLFAGTGLPMQRDVIWLASITRPDSGTWFTTDEEKAALFTTEEEADERLATLVLADGYLPGDLTLTEYVPKKEGEDDGR